MAQYIQAPDGSTIEFPDSMKDPDIVQAMGRLYPSKTSPAGTAPAGQAPKINMQMQGPIAAAQRLVTGGKPPGKPFAMPSWLAPAAGVASFGEGLLAAPLQTALGAVAGFGSRHVAKRLGASEPIADAVGVAGGLAGGLGANRLGQTAAEMSPELARIIPGGRFARYIGQRMNPPGGGAESDVQAAIQRARESAAGKFHTTEPTPITSRPAWRPEPEPTPSGTAGPVLSPPREPPGAPLMTRAAGEMAPPTGTALPRPTGQLARPLVEAAGKLTPQARLVNRVAPRTSFGPAAPPATAFGNMQPAAFEAAPAIRPILAPRISAAPIPEGGGLVPIKPTAEEMAAPFASDEAKVAQFNGRRDLAGAARHMANRSNAARGIADYARSKGYDTPEVMEAAQPEHWKAVAKAAGFPNVGPETIAAAKALLRK